MPSPARPQPAAARAKAERRKRGEEEKRRRTAATKAARAAAPEKTGRLAKEARAAQRLQTGRLRDLVLKPYTVRVYKAAVAEFFRWCRRMGHRTPSSVMSFDVLLGEWAEALWEDGDMKCILNRGLCGLAHLVPALRGRLPGAWRLYNAWSRREHRTQAPPIELLLAQALAAFFLEEGYPGAALCILVAHECILRNAEFFELRKEDLVSTPKGILLSLRETKMGQRLGVTQQVLCSSPWLAARLRRRAGGLRPGETLLDCTPVRFRQLWSGARRRLKLPGKYAVYGLRRGGATGFFRRTGSFDRVCDRGRWGSVVACRIYVTTALQDASMQEFAVHNPLWERWAAKLWQLPA